MVITRIVFAIIMITLLPSCAVLQLNLDESKIDFARLNRHAELANAAYLELPKAESELKRLNCELIKTNKQKTDEVQYILARDRSRDVDVIAVRGTASIQDAIVDLKFQLKPMEKLGINMHQGFANAALTVFGEIQPQLLKERSIDIVGHSLGGAVALSLGIILSHEGYKVGVIDTYGQPKVTDRDGAKKYRQLNVTRVVTNRDVVPLVPPIGKDEMDNIGLYWHFGPEIVLYEGADYAQLDETQSALRGLTMLIPNTLTQRELEAHSMINYLNLLTPKLQNTKRVEYKSQ